MSRYPRGNPRRIFRVSQEMADQITELVIRGPWASESEFIRWCLARGIADVEVAWGIKLANGQSDGQSGEGSGGQSSSEFGQFGQSDLPEPGSPESCLPEHEEKSADHPTQPLTGGNP